MLDRTLAPPFQNDNSLHLLEPLRYTLSNGVTSYFINGGTQEVVKIELVLQAGRWFESMPGLAYLTTQGLPKGTTKNSSNQIAELFDFYGAHLEVEAGFDFVSLSLFTLTKNLAPTLQQFVEIVVDPIFPEKEVNQVKAAYIQNLRINNQKTSYVASKEIRKMIFGDTHPYGIEVVENDIQSITPSQLTGYHQKHFGNPIVFVAGHFSNAEREMINEQLEKISNVHSPSANIDTVSPSVFSNRIEKIGSVQSSLRMGKLSVNPDHADYSKTLFVNHLLGGYFGSRLMKNIREEKGLTYGIYSSIHALRHATLLTIGADVNSENRELVFGEIKNEIGNLQTELISETELKTASAHFIGSLQAEITTPFAHADKIKELVLNNRPADHFQKTIHVVAEMTAKDVAEIAIQYFSIDSFYEVAVG